MLVVTGANGTLGSLVVERLLARVPATRIALSVREPDKAKHFSDRGVRVRQGDFEDAPSLARAFEGVTEILIISAAAVGEVALRRHRTAIDAAIAAGAKRIVYTSHMGAKPDSAFPPMKSHVATEALLEASGIPFVSLRNGFYASTPLRYLGPAIASGTLIAPADGKVSWTTHHDLAEAAAIALAEPDALHGITAPLTAGVAYDLADIARIASQVTGKHIERVVVSDDEYRQSMAARNLPELAIEMTLAQFHAARAVDFAAVDGQLEKLIGRTPRTVRDVIL
ncbi:NAD(P)H-binding protein [soil metagenome]